MAITPVDLAPAGILAMLSPWLAQFHEVTCAELTVTLPDGQLRSLRAALGPAPVPAPAPMPAPQPAPVPAPARAPPPRAGSLTPAAGSAPVLTDKERRLVAAAEAEAEPIPRKTLIRRARLLYNSHSRGLLAALIARGILTVDGAGVRAPRTSQPGSVAGTPAGNAAGMN